jgi:hypothetical protein
LLCMVSEAIGKSCGQTSEVDHVAQRLPQRIPNARILTFDYDTDAPKFAEVSPDAE